MYLISVSSPKERSTHVAAVTLLPQTVHFTFDSDLYPDVQVHSQVHSRVRVVFQGNLISAMPLCLPHRA